MTLCRDDPTDSTRCTGVCQSCTNCSKLGLATLTTCSQYSDTLCSGAPCSGVLPCGNAADRNYYCDYGAYGAVAANMTSSGVCGQCPDGYSSDGMFCYECPRGFTCSRMGDVQCMGEALPGVEAGCLGAYKVDLNPCPYTADTSKAVTRGPFLRPNGTCAPYFQCAPGYFKHHYAIGALYCEPCSNTPPQNRTWFAQGLSVNDPTSCLYECQGAETWPAGLCNAVGAPLPATPPVCPVPTDTLGDECGEWVCKSSQGVVKRGDLCFSTQTCLSVGYSTSQSGCTPSPLPWQSAGWKKSNPEQGALSGLNGVVVISPANASSSPAPPVVLVAPASDIGAGAIAFSSLAYGSVRRHWMQADGGARVFLPGQVCSAAVATLAGRRYVFVVFCNATFISFLDLTAGDALAHRLIGASTPGYAEGFKYTALFGAELYIAATSAEPRVFVSDRLNCAIRVISIPAAPGDWLTRSYWLYGSTAGTCNTGAAAILSPGRLFPISVLGQTFFLFPASDGLYQLDCPTRNVIQVLTGANLPAWVPDLYSLDGVDAANYSTLSLRFPAVTAVLTPLQVPCDEGYTSNIGTPCNQRCSLDVNYVDLASGLCLPCASRSCVSGELFVACTAYSPQMCMPCPNLAQIQGVYPRVFNRPGYCGLEYTYYVSFCPNGQYLSPTQTYAGLPVCVPCPFLSATDGDGATSVDQCRCFPGTTRTTGGLCSAGQLYPLPSLSQCPFGTYPRGAYERCTSCRVDPFPECAVGLYPLSDGSCLPCLIPVNAIATSNGKGIGGASTCAFECLPGFYPQSNTSFQVTPVFVWIPVPTPADPHARADAVPAVHQRPEYRPDRRGVLPGVKRAAGLAARVQLGLRRAVQDLLGPVRPVQPDQPARPRAALRPSVAVRELERGQRHRGYTRGRDIPAAPVQRQRLHPVQPERHRGRAGDRRGWRGRRRVLGTGGGRGRRGRTGGAGVPHTRSRQHALSDHRGRRRCR